MAGQLRQDATQIGWHESGDWVWRLDFAAGTPAVPTLTHLRIPGGRPLLRAPGFRFAWSSINGVDCARASAGGGAVGSVRSSAPRVESLPEGGAVVRQRLDYLHPSGRRELAEYRDLVFSAVGRNGKFTVDWTGHFTAGEAGAVLADEPGLRAGLGLALNGGDEPVDFVVVAPEGEHQPDKSSDDGLTLAAGIGTWLHPSARHPGSIGVVADPRSTAGAPAWELDRGAGAVVAAVLGGRAKHLAPGEVWEISYRVVVRPMQWDATDLRLELFRWLGR